MHSKRAILPALVLGLASAHSAHAITSMEDLHTGSPQEGFSGNVVLSMSNASGNVDKEDYSLGSRLQWHQNITTNYLLASGAYGKVDGVKNTEKTFLHARHIRQFLPHTAAEGYIQQETNEFARLDYRRLYGAGLRFSVYEQDNKGNIYLGLGAYYSQLKISDGFPDAGTENEWRASSYLILKYQATANTVLASTTYYQPAIGEWSDYRALQQAAAQVRLSERLSLIVTADYTFNSRPPEGVVKREAIYRTSLSVEF